MDHALIEIIALRQTPAANKLRQIEASARASLLSPTCPAA
jgi:hypothetical protein